MTVAELIKHLQTLNQELTVSVNGYEGGIQDIGPEFIREIIVQIDEHKGSNYYGAHGEVSESILEYNKEWGTGGERYEQRLLISRTTP